MSSDLKKRGFNFVGSTICYAFMQAVGMVQRSYDGLFFVTGSWAATVELAVTRSVLKFPFTAGVR